MKQSPLAARAGARSALDFSSRPRAPLPRQIELFAPNRTLHAKSPSSPLEIEPPAPIPLLHQRNRSQIGNPRRQARRQRLSPFRLRPSHPPAARPPSQSLATSTPTAVHGVLLPTVVARRWTAPLVGSSRWNWRLNASYTHG